MIIMIIIVIDINNINIDIIITIKLLRSDRAWPCRSSRGSRSSEARGKESRRETTTSFQKKNWGSCDKNLSVQDSRILININSKTVFGDCP